MSGTTTGSGIWTPRPLALGASVPLTGNGVAGTPTAGNDRFDGDATLVANVFGVVTVTLGVGPATDNFADGGAGNDVLNGNGGNDTLVGSAGNDTLNGGSGDDQLVGGTGADSLIGGAGMDTLSYADSGSGVTVSLLDGSASGGDAAGDTFVGFEAVTGGSGNDVFIGDDDANRLSGGVGNDQLEGLGGDDVLDGGDGADKLVGGDGNDRLEGGLGNDALGGGDGADTLIGGDGNDKLSGGAGADVIDGGAGNNVITYTSSTGGITIDMSGPTIVVSGGDAEGDTISGIESVSAGEGNDVLIGNGQANKLVGGLGADDIRGNAGNDALDGGAGADTLAGGDGNDKMTAGDDDDLLEGGAGNDFLDGGAGSDTVTGGLGNDKVTGGTGADLLAGEIGTDTLSYVASVGSLIIDLSGTVQTATGGDATGDTISGFESVLGGRGDDLLVGNGGANKLVGANGTDTLRGGAGNDALQGGNGDDLLVGGSGGDKLTGGAGADTFLWALADDGPGRDSDVVADFNRLDADHFDLSAFGATYVGDGNLLGAGEASVGWRLRSVGTGVDILIDYNGDGTADLFAEVRGVTSLVEQDFIL